jgi:translation initiation factor IF-1
VDSDGERGPGRGAQVSARETTVNEVVGTVVEQLPSALYRVRLEVGPQVTAHIADRLDRNFIRLLIGDRVRVELSPVDVTRGRIVGKL